uniref:EGF-like domain-containing protein n=1 Tax=Panagrellus redivivus TaxID=6233 RepID=A0A7E4ZUY9_PANRE
MNPLIVISICITSAFASEYSLFDYENTSTITLTNNSCPPLFYGPNCNVPYCVPGNGRLRECRTNTYYCQCYRFISGTHCEKINCNDGWRLNSTVPCECPWFRYGEYCQQLLYGDCGIYLIILLIFAVSWGLCYKFDKKTREDTQRNYRFICEMLQTCCSTIRGWFLHGFEKIKSFTKLSASVVRKVITRQTNDDANRNMYRTDTSLTQDTEIFA